MNKQEAKNRIEKLKKEIDKIRYHYHVLDELIVPEGVKDSLQHELEKLEFQFPELITKDSPTQRVAGKPLSKFSKIQHSETMLSLSDSFSLEELTAWEERNKKILNEPFDYFVELKIDGFAVSLVYENGILKTGATRGDGKIGEDITQNLKTIESIPLKLKKINELDRFKKGKIEVRGEVYLSKKEFEKINKERQKNNLPLYANPRNLAAGTVRQLDSKITAERKLDAFMYEIVTDLGLKTHQDKHNLLKKLGFKISPYVKHCKNINQVYQYAQSWENKRNNLSFQVDGLVVIINSLKTEKKLGSVGKAPRWATAYKFSPEKVSTRVKNIKVSIGRTGALTPYAILEPVRIAGSTVKRATLHNEDEIKRKDIRIGDTVIVQKAGDIIPEILEPIKSLRSGNERIFFMPKECPICGGRAIKPSGEAIYRCENKECWAIEKEKIIHFVSKNAFNIEGLGEKIVEKFMEAKLITDSADIFYLKKEDILLLEGFKDKSADNLIKSIKNSKTITLDRLIYSLGIRHVGIQTANLLSLEFQSLEKLKKASLDNLKKLRDIGSVASLSIYSWFRNQKNLDLIERLFKAGVNYKRRGVSEKFKNKNFVITGSFKIYSRNQLEEIIRNYSGKVLSVVSNNTDYLILGENPGSKLDKAKKIGISIIKENQIKDLLG